MIKPPFFSKRHQRAPDPKDPQENDPWDSLNQVEFAGGGHGKPQTAEHQNPEDPELIISNPRQQNKIIHILSSGDTDTISMREVNVDESERQRVLFAIKNQDFSDQDFNEIIDCIAGPLSPTEGPDGSFIPPSSLNAVYGRMSNLKHERRILARMSGLGTKNYMYTSPDSLITFAERFANPAQFETASQSFLNEIKAFNSPQKYQEYVAAMKNFKHLVYGKKQEYYDQIKLLKANAKDFDGDAYLSQKYFTPATAEYEAPSQSEPSLKERLTEGDLGPKYELKIKDAEIGLSDIFKAGSRDACIAYVKIGDKVRIRSYYRSRSAALWRYLPDYVMKNNEIVHYGKANTEEQLTLPVELQIKLSEIGRNHPNKKTVDSQATIPLLCAPAKCYYSEDDYLNARDQGELYGEYYEETDPDPSLMLGHSRTHKKPPDRVNIPDVVSPDYSRMQGSYILDDHPCYGHNVKVSLFPSRDNKFLYSICEAEVNGERQVWIGNIESLNSPVNSAGCNQKWVSAGDVMTPLYEYPKQADGYGEDSNNRYGYQNMWSNYLSKIPTIKHYLQEVPM